MWNFQSSLKIHEVEILMIIINIMISHETLSDFIKRMVIPLNFFMMWKLVYKCVPPFFLSFPNMYFACFYSWRDETVLARKCPATRYTCPLILWTSVKLYKSDVVDFTSVNSISVPFLDCEYKRFVKYM